MDNSSIIDIIQAADEGSPSAVRAAFNSAMAEKLTAALDAKRDEIATSLYSTPEEDNNEE